ncbi:MAG: hypothetical protein LBP59_19805 [Planctomycetaceae bacterium]|nr:hypothetical protein [Planctomycetaceae bacterium]
MRVSFRICLYRSYLKFSDLKASKTCRPKTRQAKINENSIANSLNHLNSLERLRENLIFTKLTKSQKLRKEVVCANHLIVK